MAEELPGEITRLLSDIRADVDGASDELIELVYATLREQAAGLMRRERAGHTLPPTAVVHEALLKLLGGGVLARLTDRENFFRAARAFMRYVLVSHARYHRAGKHGGTFRRVPLDVTLDNLAEEQFDVVALHDAVERLAEQHERPGHVVTLRFFLGLTMEAVAERLGVSLGTVENDFRFARAWLLKRLA
jgi:RNA polymerase sigma factor (TIGR02999 family)